MKLYEKVLSKSLVILLSLVITAGGFEGCSKINAKQETKEGAAASNLGKLEISLTVPYFSTEAPSTDNVFVKEIEKETNTRLNITWIPNAAYNEKINTMIASNTLPQVFVNKIFKEPATINNIKAGMFWEIGEKLNQFPNLSKLDPDVLKNISVEGKIYALYRPAPASRNCIIYRRDWLDNLGLKEPKTINELYNVIKAFTLNDPDRNGKNDTVGLAETSDIGSFKAIMSYMGGANEWEVGKDGKFRSANETEEGLEAAEFMRKLYSEKLMNQDFAVLKSGQHIQLINKGKAGLIFAVTDDIASKFTELYRAYPNAKLDFLTRISGPKGERIHASGEGYAALFMFPKPAYKDEKQLEQVLGFFDKLLDKKFHDLAEWGIEGRHYSIMDGVPTRTQQQADLFALESGPVKQIRINGGELAMKGKETEIVERYKKALVDNLPIVVYDPSAALISQTFSEKGTTLKQLKNDQRIKFIMGDINQEGWEKANEQWRKEGGNKVCEEFTAAYEK